jgi:TRAP-type transport system small permease protein
VHREIVNEWVGKTTEAERKLRAASDLCFQRRGCRLSRIASIPSANRNESGLTAIFTTFDHVLQRLTEVVVGLLMAGMAVCVLLGVFYRYVLGDALAWSEEAARYLMIWLSWIGGGLALRRGGHIAVDLVVNALPAMPRRLMLMATQLAAITFLVIVLATAIDLTGRVSMQSTIALQISMQVPYAAMPVGTALMIYHALIMLLAGTLGRTALSSGEGSDPRHHPPSAA